jgi:EmrB/QacA subfamily drug resistance transporter
MTSTATTSSKLEPRLIRLALVLSLGSAATLLDTTIVSVAINRLSREFGSPLATIQWVTTAYLLAMTAVLPLTSWAVARYGVRRMWFVCLIGFGLGSLLCALSWSAGALIAFRVIQGLGGGMLLPLIRIAFAQEVEPSQMGRLMSFVVVPTQLAPIVGPVLGGLIIGALNWRWAFLVNVPVVIAALILSRRLITGGPAATRPPLDVRGLLLLSPGLAVLIYGLTSYGESGRLPAPALVVGVLLLVGYGVHALRTVTPIFDLRLFHDRSFSACAALVFIFGGSLFGAMLLLPLFYQQTRAAGPLAAGLLLAPQGVGAIVGTIFVGKVLDRTGAARTIMLVGLAAAVAGTLPFALATGSTPIPLLAAALVIRGIGLTMALVPSMTATYATLPKSEFAAASTGTRMLQQVGGSLGTAVLAVVLQRGSFPAAFWTTVGVTAVAAVAALALPSQPKAA